MLMSLIETLQPQRWLALAALLLPLAACAGEEGEAAPPAEDAQPEVRVVANEAENRVEVLVDGALFTAYLYPSTIQKPVLYPIRSSAGQTITRGYPLEPTPGERVDHPHHIGLWFNYGDVNGLDFWNNSDAIPENRRANYGTIVHREIRGTEDGTGEGALEVTAEWVNHEGEALLREETRFEFGAEGDTRTIDRFTTLTALEEPVTFTDNKEGMLGLRVTRALEHPATKPEIFTDASGQPTEVAVLDNEGLTREFSGTGLGLSIVKGIVEGHGGSVWAESAGYDPDGCPGTTVYIRLPVRQDESALPQPSAVTDPAASPLES